MKKKIINNSFLLSGLFLTLITVLLMLLLNNQNLTNFWTVLLKIELGILIFNSALFFFMHYKYIKFKKEYEKLNQGTS